MIVGEIRMCIFCRFHDTQLLMCNLICLHEALYNGTNKMNWKIQWLVWLEKKLRTKTKSFKCTFNDMITF